MPYAYNPATGRDEFVDSVEAMFQPTTSTTTVEDLYKELGRPADTGGKAFWETAFGPTVDETEKSSFMKSVKDVLGKSSTQEQQVLAPTLFGGNITPNEDPNFVSPLTTKNVAGKDYTIATKDLNTLKNQILGQNLTSKWSGQGYGSAEANADDMAKILASMGITDIKDFGKVSAYTPVEDTGLKSYNGQTLNQQYNPDGTITYGTYKGTGQIDSEGNEGSIFTPVPKDAKLESVYGLSNGESYDLIDPSKIVKKDGQVLAQTGETFGNKKTGQVVPRTYGERQFDNAWGGTFEGKGNTGYRVQFAPDGTPIFYTTGASSNDLANMFTDTPILGVVANIAASYFGGPAGVAALHAAMGEDASDIAKSAALSYLGNQVAQGVSGFEGVTDVFGDVGSKIVGNTAGQYVSSGGKIDPLQALISGGVGAGTNAILGQIPDFGTLDPTIQKLVTKAVSSTLMGGSGLSSQDLVNAAINAGRRAAKSDTSTELKNTYGSTEEFDPSKTDWASMYADASDGSPAGLNVAEYANQDFGVNPLDNFDSYQNTMNQISNNGGFSSQWQTVGTNRVFVNDDGTATIFDPTTEQTSFLTQEQVDALVGAGVLNSEDSGYLKAIGGTGAKTLAKTTPKKTTTPTTTDGSTTIKAPSQDPYANIKSMEELFGGDIDYKLRALGAPKNVASADIDALAKLLKG